MITTTQTTIANRALQILGYKPIGSIQDNDRGARAVNRAYYPVLYALLRRHNWNFALRRIVLPAAAVAPTFGFANAYPLPSDYLKLAPDDMSFGWSGSGTVSGPPKARDWVIEGNQILSDDPAPIQVRYVTSQVLESAFDASFAEAFAACLAIETCEELTQSNTKLANCGKIYDAAMEDAAQNDAFEKRPQQSPVSSWTSARY